MATFFYGDILHDDIPHSNNFPGLVFRELRVLPPKTLSMATTAVTFPVSEFSIAISLALIVSSASLITFRIFVR